MASLSVYRSFDELPAALPAQTPFFFSRTWFAHLAATSLAPAQRLQLCRLALPGGAVLLPLCEEAPSGRLRLRRLAALANFYTPLFGAVREGETGPDAAAAALGALLAGARRRWDLVDLHPLPAEPARLDALAAMFRRAGMVSQRYFCFGNWYLPVGGRSYQAYFDSLPSRLRHTLARKTRQLQQGARLRTEIVTGEEGLDAAIGAYEAIYASSWKQAEPFPAFMPGLMRLCAQQGCLRLGVAWIDGQPAAAQLWIVQDGVAAIYKLAYDARFARWSAGSILTAALMRHAIDEDRVDEIDYLMGDDAYKRDWMTHRRERVGMVAFNLRTLRGWLAACRHIGGDALKGLLRARGRADAG